MTSLSNSEDPDEMPPYGGISSGIYYLLTQNDLQRME